MMTDAMPGFIFGLIDNAHSSSVDFEFI
jgi:hypothetical protein